VLVADSRSTWTRCQDPQDDSRQRQGTHGRSGSPPGPDAPFVPRSTLDSRRDARSDQHGSVCRSSIRCMAVLFQLWCHCVGEDDDGRKRAASDRGSRVPGGSRLLRGPVWAGLGSVPMEPDEYHSRRQGFRATRQWPWEVPGAGTALQRYEATQLSVMWALELVRLMKRRAGLHASHSGTGMGSSCRTHAGANHRRRGSPPAIADESTAQWSATDQALVSWLDRERAAKKREIGYPGPRRGEACRRACGDDGACGHDARVHPMDLAPGDPIARSRDGQPAPARRPDRSRAGRTSQGSSRRLRGGSRTTDAPTQVTVHVRVGTIPLERFQRDPTPPLKAQETAMPKATGETSFTFTGAFSGGTRVRFEFAPPEPTVVAV